MQSSKWLQPEPDEVSTATPFVKYDYWILKKTTDYRTVKYGLFDFFKINFAAVNFYILVRATGNESQFANASESIASTVRSIETDVPAGLQYLIATIGLLEHLANVAANGTNSAKAVGHRLFPAEVIRSNLY